MSQLLVNDTFTSKGVDGQSASSGCHAVADTAVEMRLRDVPGYTDGVRLVAYGRDTPGSSTGTGGQHASRWHSSC
ncbi:hypothetical protein WJX79_010652 [Trebouxia sp. C0005]